MHLTGHDSPLARSRRGLRKITLLAFALTVLTFLAAVVTAQSEIPIGSLDEVPAPGFRGELRLASNGEGFLATWHDSRSVLAGYGARIGADGSVVDRLGFRLPFSPADLSWDGVHYVISDRQFAARVQPDGTIVDPSPRRVVPVGAWGIGFTTNGARSISVFRDGSGQVYATLFDRNLIPRSERISLPLDEFDPFPFMVGVDGLPDGTFLIILTSPSHDCPSGCPMFAYQVDPVSASLASRFTIEASPDVVGETAYDLAAGEVAFAIATFGYDTRKTVVRTFALDGSPAATHVLFHEPEKTYGAPPDVAAVEAGFVVSFSTFNEGGATNRFARLDENGGWDGSLLVPEPAGAGRWQPRVAWNGTSTLVAFSTSGPGSQDRNFEVGIMDTTGQIEELQPLARSLTPGNVVAVASNGDVDLALFSSGSYGRGYELRAATVEAGGPPHVEGLYVATRTLADVPAAAAPSPGGFTIAWLDDEVLFTRRMSLSGDWMDPEPHAVANGACELSTASLAPFGSGLAVVFSACPLSRVMLLPLDPDGLPLGPAVQIGSEERIVSSPVIAEGGGTHLVIWQYTPPFICPVLCYIPPDQLRACLIDADGQPSGEPFELSGSGGGSYHPPAVSWTGSNYLVTWGLLESVYALRLSGDGTLLDAFGGERLTEPKDPGDPRPSLGFDGRRALVVWSDNQTGQDEELKVLVLDPKRPLAEQSALNAQSITTGVSRGFSSPPTSVTSPRGRVLALLYSRVLNDPSYGGVSRVFLRRLIDTPRARPVRRPTP
jgi:hypothetical protein